MKKTGRRDNDRRVDHSAFNKRCHPGHGTEKQEVSIGTLKLHVLCRMIPMSIFHADILTETHKLSSHPQNFLNAAETCRFECTGPATLGSAAPVFVNAASVITCAAVNFSSAASYFATAASPLDSAASIFASAAIIFSSAASFFTCAAPFFSSAAFIFVSAPSSWPPPPQFLVPPYHFFIAPQVLFMFPGQKQLHRCYFFMKFHFQKSAGHIEYKNKYKTN